MAFLSLLLEAGVDVRFADLPLIEGATGKFLLQQMAAVAELEAGMISARTKAALAAAKRRGVKLGGDRGARLTAKARAASSSYAARISADRETRGQTMNVALSGPSAEPMLCNTSNAPTKASEPMASVRVAAVLA